MFVPDENVLLHPWEAITDKVGRGPNNCLTLVVHRTNGLLRFDAADCGGVPHVRVGQTIEYLRHLHTIACTIDSYAARDAASFVFQTDDNPVDMPSVSWERQRGWTHVTLVPDIYYYSALGYADFLPHVVPWLRRRDQLLWRGSTTGVLGLTLDRLPEMLRYQMCRIAAELGDAADCGFTGVVQGITAEDNAAVEHRLADEGLLRGFVPPTEMQNARYAIDIDGNANSWNLIQRLRLGCCMLRVQSPWYQWLEERLIPWRHYVPIAADLSNLAERLDWCRSHPVEAEGIAYEGRSFAMEMSYPDELLMAARRLFVFA